MSDPIYFHVPPGRMAVRLYDQMLRGSQVMKFLAPEAECHDSKLACEFLRALADEIESYQKKEYPDGMPF